MCGRFAFYSPKEAVHAVFGVELPFEIVPRYNVAPSQLVAAIRAAADGAPEGAQLRWGLVPFWAKDPAMGQRMINARGESLGEKPAFRNAWRRRRCVVLANGFYEWRSTGKSAAKTPYYIAPPDGRPIAFAGLWERWEKGAESLETCTIITTAASRTLAPIHDRMPVILSPDDLRAWLDQRQPPEALARLLVPAPEDRLACHEVGRAVNSPANDNPDLIAAVN